MLALGLRCLHHEIDEAARDGDLPGRDGAAGDERLRLADDETAAVMRRLSDGQSIKRYSFFVH